jgi:hypothetical protein
MKHRILAFICSIAAAFTASAQVPSLINYQGRLTDSNGAPVTGSKNFAISIYDAATGGNLLYEETIGAVTLDANGVYSFQFGSAGSSTSQVTETIATTDDTNLTYSKSLSNAQVVNNSITVTDGTNSWNQSVGNPGVGATATANTIVGFVIGATITNGGSGYTTAPAVTITGNGTGAEATATITNGVVTGITIVNAGSGYTSGATITIDAPVIPFRVDYSGGIISATYSSVPTAGQTISATYRYNTSGITGALNAAAEQWMSVSVNGFMQSTRQRVLAVPFAVNSAKSQWSAYAADAKDNSARMAASSSSEAIARYSGENYTSIATSKASTGTAFGEFFTTSYGYGGGDYVAQSPVLISSAFVGYSGNYFSTSLYGSITFYYADGTSATVSWSGMLPDNALDRTKKNPYPEKLVTRVSGNQYYEYWYAGPRSGNAMVLTLQTADTAAIRFSVGRTAKTYFACPVVNDIQAINEAVINVYYSDGSLEKITPNTWINLSQSKTISFLELEGKPKGTGRISLTSMRLLGW